MEEAKTTPKGPPYHLVLAIVNRGCSEQVMEAARPAGARGGTVILARRVGYEDVQNMLGFTLQPEKEIVAILLPQEQKLPVMQGHQPGGRPEDRLPGRALLLACGRHHGLAGAAEKINPSQNKRRAPGASSFFAARAGKKKRRSVSASPCLSFAGLCLQAARARPMRPGFGCTRAGSAFGAGAPRHGGLAAKARLRSMSSARSMVAARTMTRSGMTSTQPSLATHMCQRPSWS